MLQERPTELDMFMAYQVSNIRLIASITFYLHNHITMMCRDHEHVCFLFPVCIVHAIRCMHYTPSSSVLWCKSSGMSSLTVVHVLQVVHKEQYDDKRQVLQEATTVDDMYDMLAVYEQKVVTADQVCRLDVSCTLWQCFSIAVKA